METKYDNKSNELSLQPDVDDRKRARGVEVRLQPASSRRVPVVVHGAEIVGIATVVLGSFGILWQLQDHGIASPKLAMVLAAAIVLLVVVVVPFVRDYFASQKAALQADFDRGLQRVDQLLDRAMAAFDERLNRIQPALNVAQAFAPAAQAAGPAVAAVAGHSDAITKYGPYVCLAAAGGALLWHRHTPAQQAESAMERRSRIVRNSLPIILASLASYLDDAKNKDHFVKKFADHIKSVSVIVDVIDGTLAQKAEMFQEKADRKHVHFVQGETLNPDGTTEPAPLPQTDADLMKAAGELHKGLLRVHADQTLSVYPTDCEEGLHPSGAGARAFTYRIKREVYELVYSCDGYIRITDSAAKAAAGAGIWGLKCDKCGGLGCNGKEAASNILWRMGQYEYLLDSKLPKVTVFHEENYQLAVKGAAVGLAVTAGAVLLASALQKPKRRCENCKKEHDATFVNKWGTVLPSRWCDDCVIKTTDEKMPTYAEACGPQLPEDDLGKAQHVEAFLDRDGKFTELLEKYRDGKVTADEVVTIVTHTLLPCDYCREILCDKRHYWPKMKEAFLKASASYVGAVVNGAVGGALGFGVGAVIALWPVLNHAVPRSAPGSEYSVPREYQYRPGLHVFECADFDVQVPEATDDDVAEANELKGFKGGRKGFKSNEKYKRRPFSMHKINRHKEQHQAFSSNDKKIALRMYTSDPILSGDLVEIGGKQFTAGSGRYHKAIDQLFKQGGGWVRNMNKDRSRIIWIEKYDEEKSKMPFKDSDDEIQKREDDANWYAAQREAKERADEEGDFRDEYKQKLEAAEAKIKELEAGNKWLQSLVNELENNMPESKVEINLQLEDKSPKLPPMSSEVSKPLLPLPTPPNTLPQKAEQEGFNQRLPQNIARKAHELFQCQGCILRRHFEVNKWPGKVACDDTTGIMHKARLPGSCPGHHKGPFCWFEVCSKLAKAVADKKKAVAAKAEAMNAAVPVMAVAKANCYGWILAPAGDKAYRSHAVFIKVGGKPMVRVCWHGVVLATGVPTLFYGEDCKSVATLQRLSDHPSGAWHEDLSDDAFYPCPEDAVKWCVDVEQPGAIEGKNEHVTLLHFKDLKDANLRPCQQVVPVLHRVQDHAICAGEGKDVKMLTIRECMTYKPNTWDSFSGAPVFNDKGRVIGYHMSSPGRGVFKDGQVASFAIVNMSEHNKASQAKNLSAPTLQTNPTGSGASSKQKSENARKRA